MDRARILKRFRATGPDQVLIDRAVNLFASLDLFFRRVSTDFRMSAPLMHAPRPQPLRRDAAACQHRVTQGVADRVGGQVAVGVDHVGVEGCLFVVAGAVAFTAFRLSLGRLAVGFRVGAPRITLDCALHRPV